MSTKGQPPKPRLRASCDGCFLAKVKCSKARPICRRCMEIGLICRYSPSSRAPAGTSGASASSGRGRPNRQLMMSTMSDESCEDLSRWLSQQWAAGGVSTNGPGPSHMPVWHGSQAGLTGASRIGHAQGGATVPSGSHGTSNASTSIAGVLNPVVLAPPPGWASYQPPSYPVGPSSPYNSMPNSAQGFPGQQAPWAATFEASPMHTPNHNTPLLPPPHFQQPHSPDRFRSQSFSDSPHSTSGSSEFQEWTLTYLQTQQEYRTPYSCEPSDSPEHQTWNADDFINNHSE